MGITVDIKKKTVAKDREPDSREEVPESVRRAAGSTLGSPGGSPIAGPAGNRSVVFNGKEYADVTAMPEDERRLFEKAIQSIKVTSDARTKEGAALEFQKGGQVTFSLVSYRKSRSDSPSLISRILLWGLIAIVLVWGVYYLLS